MATQREQNEPQPLEGEALRREAMSRADDIQAQYEESQRLDPNGEKRLYIRHGSSEEIRRQLRGG